MLSSSRSPSSSMIPSAVPTSQYVTHRQTPSDVTLPLEDSPPVSLSTTTARETSGKTIEQTTPPTTKPTSQASTSTFTHLKRIGSEKANKMKRPSQPQLAKVGVEAEIPPNMSSKADPSDSTANPPPTEKPFSLSNITRKARKPSISSLARSASVTSRDRKDKKDRNEQLQTPSSNLENATNPPDAKPPSGHKPSHSRGLSFANIRSLKSKSNPDRINETNVSEGASIRSSRSLRAKASLERLAASVRHPNSSAEEVPPVPRAPAHILKGQGHGQDQGRKKDELWSVFRSLDDDAQKFQSKSANLKANMIRTSLLPVLSRIAQHPSNTSLRPEDLDRRVSILNKWWLAMFETVNWSSTQQIARPAVTGADRPVYFDALVAIMARPEWNYPTSAASSGSLDSTTTSGSEGSMNSANSEFFVESIYHNVRHTYAHNLLVQLSYCFDRLNLRNASSSLINFSAKTIAYAFLYCPNVADMLARLWKLPPDLLRRVFSLFDQSPDMKERQRMSEEIASYFPSACRTLAATSHAAISRHLRRGTAPPPDVCRLNWFGAWQSRWSARESDLFFSFAKQYYILVKSFLPADTPSSKMVYVPGLVAVHAQILFHLQNSVTRGNNPYANSNEFSSGLSFGTPTFDDLLPDADAPTPFARSMSNRVISENKSLLFLRDVIVDQSLEQSTKLFVVETICDLLKAVARKTSLFDHVSCAALLDVVQAHINVVVPFAKEVKRPTLVDWKFWLDVSHQMLQSNNSGTEFRVISFWYSAWDDICESPNGKEELCYGLILNDSLFYQYFNHWSAMVRAYFHRLVCWRLARYDGQPRPLETQLFLELRRKLNIIYEFCEAHEESGDRAPLITIPSNPAPSCRLAIERFETNPPCSSYVCLDHVVPSASRNDHYVSHPPKSRWNAFKNIFTASGPGSNSSSRSQSPSSDHDQLGESSSDGSRRALDYSSSLRLHNETFAAPRCHFQFTLQPADRNRFTNYNPRLLPPPLPLPLRLYLQSLNNKGDASPEKSWLSAKTDSETESPDTQHTLDSPSTSPGTALTEPSPREEPGNDAGDAPTKQERPSSRSTSVNGDLRDGQVTTSVRDRRPSSAKKSTSPIKERSLPGKTQNILANSLGASKYSGRSLSEWCLVVAECDNHHERRREAGVPSNQQVEIPMLAADLKR